MTQVVTYTADDGSVYVDGKRRMWVFSLTVPMLIFVGPLLYLLTDNALALWFPLLFNYLVIPALDLILGEDTSNPPESVVPQLEADPYYRYVTYALVPIIWGAFLFSAWFVGTQELPWHGVLAMILLMGGICGFGMNLGHELGHKKDPLERWLAKFVLALGGYGHFFIEHNKGHHRDVATPEDPASSRMGESIWQFVRREMPGAARRAWQLEKQRLEGQGKPVWSLGNEIIQPALITLALYAGLIAAFGWIMVPFLLAVAFWGAFQLTSANYIEHYGLLRQKMPNGRYEPPRPQHSWNSNHVFSNWATFHLQRHSDHHAHPVRRYQSLRHFDNLPTLPNGYFGMFLVAYIPALWYAVMDRRLLEHVDYDASRINFNPARKDALMRRYNLKPALPDQAA
ncbi:MAG: alkane 1-monooxygenase [Alcanivoracaceae bacterium]|jgi:alkane 1-monooxygenase|nr:alkane 1-monooxygenase [Alcanivoracaceae bacterium]